MKKFSSPWSNIHNSQNSISIEKGDDPNLTTFINLGMEDVIVTTQNGLFKNFKDSVILKPSEIQVVYRQFPAKALGKVKVQWKDNKKWKSESSTFNHNYDTIGVSSTQMSNGARTCNYFGEISSSCDNYVYHRSSKNHIAYANVAAESMQIQNWNGPVRNNVW